MTQNITFHLNHIMSTSFTPPTHVHQIGLRLPILLLAILLAPVCMQAQYDFNIPASLAKRTLPDNRPISAQEVQSNFYALMQDPDTALAREKKLAQRWMAYTYPYLDVDSTGALTNEPYNDAVNAIFTSPLFCNGNDMGNWESDGPRYMPDWFGKQPGGWIDAVYNNPNDTNQYFLGTKTSGFMRSTDGGEHWNSVTDNLNFPVLGARQFLIDPDDPARIIALTGTEHIDGGIVYSDDAGATWTQNQQDLPQFYWMGYHPFIDDLIFAISEKEVFVSFDNGLNFTPLTLRRCAVYSIKYDKYS